MPFKTKSLRKGRSSKEGHFYHVVLNTKDNIQIFNSLDTSRKMTQAMKESDDKGISITYAFVIMPDHVHWLFQLKLSALSTCIQRVKSQFSRESKFNIWQKGFYDHGIRNDESLIRTARYIVANPLRSKLVTKIGDYPYWDSIWMD